MAENREFFVTAIVVTHDGATWLAETVAAISAQHRLPNQIIAVDNGSTDISVRMLKNAGISIIEQDRKSGFGSAVAAAVAALPDLNNSSTSSNSREEWLWILHDDSAPRRDALENMLAAISDRPQVAIAGPKILGWHDRKHVLEAGVSIAENGTRWTGMESREHDQGQHDDVKEVLAVSTAGMLIKREVFEQLGGFDPSLELFRDDVDLGWRAHVAGHSVVRVGSAAIYHAEAATNERRSIDVKDALLHRPLLLDRRNAAFVMLANSSWWLLPWISLQLLTAALARSFVYLLAKLPGYAADEIAAVGLLIFKPQDLINSRRQRRKHKLLSPRVIKPFIPRRGILIRATIVKSINAITKPFRIPAYLQERVKPRDYADIGVLDESFDELEFVPRARFARIRALSNRPLLFGLLITFVLNFFYARNRIGNLSGAALPVAPESAKELFGKFLEPWHIVGLGTTSPAPVWVGVIAALSALTFGNPQVFIWVFLWITPSILFWLSYRSAQKFGLQRYAAFILAIVYSYSPVVTTAINQGRIGTVAVAISLPVIFTLSKHRREINDLSWRRIFTISSLSGLTAAFSPLFLASWCLLHISYFLIRYINFAPNVKNLDPREILHTLDRDEFKKRAVYIFTPLILTIPWSLSLLIHPTRFLLEPGLAFATERRWSMLLFNPGGIGAPPIWVTFPFLLFLVVALFNSRFASFGIVGLICTSSTVVLSAITISGNSTNEYQIFAGPILVFAQLLSLFSILAIAQDEIPKLKNVALGFKHLLAALLTGTTAIALAINLVWVVTAGASSPLKTDQEQVVPAFLTDLAKSPTKPKLLVLGKTNDQWSYFITRSGDLQLGDPDIATKTPVNVVKAINQMVSGSDVTASQILGEYGISYVFLKNPIDENLARLIDGQGGFERNSATKDGLVWRVVNANSRVMFVDKSNKKFPLESGEINLQGNIATLGQIVLAENFSSSWQLVNDGKIISPNRNADGLPIFAVDKPGEIFLSFNGTSRRAWLSLQIFLIFVILVLALPAGRKRREIEISELS